MIDLRSDTLTRPSKDMLEAMMNAPVGDDVFGEDPSINKLQEDCAKLFGMDGSLFCPSGTMTNQIAISCHVQAFEEIILERDSHIYQYEGGGIFHHSRASVKLLDGNAGKITAHQIKTAINPVDIHRPTTKLVSLENTTNRGGGATYSIEELREISKVCKENNLLLHLDGARFFNAHIIENYDLNEIGQIFDSISICLSKGLGCPVGSLLLGSNEFLKKALRVRKVFGGGMRQAGFLAAAGSYALERNIERLKEDHLLAKSIEKIIKNITYIEKSREVVSNIVIFDLDNEIDPNHFLSYLKENNLLAVSFGGQAIRFVTHLDVDKDILKDIENILNNYTY
ncbi:low specificity L-threonine aldolase [Halobacteriovorax sp. HLS]|uniref:threonine aldolase family protein n=1 Tax=Halobacteriovorax sp. HLS TaxID=2234000 RepID=UPI000FD7CA5C|nr:GntG family PLP-dependent aldolase [Halobacteriovorax sp. HLS]